ncbi:hypothetical protein ACN28S_50785 [Cystobacter fuscus]
MHLASPRDVTARESGSLDVADEVLATQALACQGELLRVLRSPRWKWRLRVRVDLLRGALALEPAVSEWLARGAPGAHRRLLARRERLERVARARLARLSHQEGTSLAEVLGHLERLMSEPLPRPPGDDEPVLFEGAQGLRHFLAWPGAWGFALLVLTHQHLLGRRASVVPVLVLGGALLAVYFLRYTGRFWLTARRLVWQPRLGEPVQVSLASIAPEGITALAAWGEVRVEGERRVTVRHAGAAGRLAALLELHRRSPFLGRVDGTPRVRDVSVVPAWRGPEGAVPGSRTEPGVAVLRPGYAAFLPAHRAADMFQGLTAPLGAKPEADAAGVDVSVELLVEQLRLLPEADFDAYLRQAVFAQGGELWFADEVRPGEAASAGHVCLVGARGVGMQLRPDSIQAEATHRIVRQWAA